MLDRNPFPTHFVIFQTSICVESCINSHRRFRMWLKDDFSRHGNKFKADVLCIFFVASIHIEMWIKLVYMRFREPRNSVLSTYEFFFSKLGFKNIKHVQRIVAVFTERIESITLLKHSLELEYSILSHICDDAAWVWCTM